MQTIHNNVTKKKVANTCFLTTILPTHRVRLSNVNHLHIRKQAQPYEKISLGDEKE